MSGKEICKSIIFNFFIVVTLVNIAIFVLGTVFQGDKQMGYEAFLAPLIYGAMSMLPIIVMYSRRELTMREIIVRKLIQLLLLEVLLYVGGYGIESMKTKSIFLTISFGASVMIIFVLANVISYLLNAREAEELTSLLKKYQEN